MPSDPIFGYRNDRAIYNFRHRRVSYNGIGWRMRYDFWHMVYQMKEYGRIPSRDNYRYYRKFWDSHFPQFNATPICQFMVRRGE